jgi:hypothetical protein
MAECRIISCRYGRKAGQRLAATRSSLSRTFQDRRSRLMFSLWVLRLGLVVHWSGYVAVACMWWRRLHSSSLYPTVAHHSVGLTRRVIQFHESEMPFVSLETLLVHDKTFLGILSEMDTEFTEIRGITDVASSHRNISHPMSSLSFQARFASALPQPYTRRYKNSRATHAAASIKGMNHCWRKLFIEILTRS